MPIVLALGQLVVVSIAAPATNIGRVLHVATRQVSRSAESLQRPAHVPAPQLDSARLTGVGLYGRTPVHCCFKPDGTQRVWIEQHIADTTPPAPPPVPRTNPPANRWPIDGIAPGIDHRAHPFRCRRSSAAGITAT